MNRIPHHPTAYDDDWEDLPTQGWFYKWVLGIGVPIGMAVFGVLAMTTREATFAARGSAIRLHGSNAVAFGIVWLAAAVFVHCHYYWGNVYANAWFAVLGKIVSAIAFIGGLAFLIVRVGVFGIA